MDCKIGILKMRLKHNKKRNTAFLFEVLIREYVKSVVRKNASRQNSIKNIIKDHFCEGILKEELLIYRELLESKGMKDIAAHSVLEEAKHRYNSLDRKQVFSHQNRLIKEINYTLSPNVFTNFVPNYKSIATIYNIFNNKTSMKEKVLLENKVVEMLTTENNNDNKSHVDNLTYKTFVKKFNDKYGDLPEDQRNLLTTYIVSFSDNDVELKHQLNEQIAEMKEKIENIKEDEIFENQEIKEKYEKVHEKLHSFKDKEIDEVVITEVLMIQELIREIGNA